jgi:hypothetical protein
MSGWRRTGDTKSYTREELLYGIQNFIIEAGRLPTSRDADTGWHGLPSVSAYKREFGSWRAAMQEFGMPADSRGGHNAGQSKNDKRQQSPPTSRSRIQPTKGE